MHLVDKCEKLKPSFTIRQSNKLPQLTDFQLKQFHHSGKIFLSETFLEQYMDSSQTEQPLFILQNDRNQRAVCVGIMGYEMIPHDTIILNDVLKIQLDVQPQDQLRIQRKDLKPCTYIKFKPDSASVFDNDVENLLNAKLNMYPALKQSQWLQIEGKSTIWIQVVKCEPEMCQMCHMDTNEVKVEFEKANDLDEWQLKKNDALLLGQFELAFPNAQKLWDQFEFQNKEIKGRVL